MGDMAMCMGGRGSCFSTGGGGGRMREYVYVWGEGEASFPTEWGFLYF